MGPTADFARRLRRLRGPLTQHELAARARMHRSHLAKIELGQREPTVSTIVKLARALHVKPGQFFEDAPGSGRRGKRRRKT
jgi:transcriptional regulator with XRE-family HTH domain